MKRSHIMTVMFLMLVCCIGMRAQGQHYYGYSPFSPDMSDITAHGSGRNNYAEALVCLDPSADPLMKRLKGSKVIGVRCFLRADYRQESQGRSSIMLYKGSLTDAPVKKLTDFSSGWNEVLFDEPVEIGDDRLYVGMKVFETKGTPYPFAAYEPISVPNSFFINIGGEGWNDYRDRGTLLVQAIVSSASGVFENVAYVNATDFPLAVAPGSEFDCRMYVHNLSCHPITSVEVESIAGENGTPLRQSFVFDTPVAAYDGRMVPATFLSSSTESAAEPVVLNVTKVNGSESSATLSGFFSMYVTEDVFTRIPLIEEFTGLRCSNCPLMSYYLDVALEEYADPYVYVAHHAGFADDDFTTDADKEILYLFGNKGTYNPAIMYDRTVLKGELLPVYGVTELSPAPYLAALSEVAACPAQAMVLVDVTRENGNVSCRVHGKVSKVMMRTGDDFYLSAYIVEDGIPEEKYPQEGLDVEGAPEDLSDRFAHNGVIRHNFCQDPAGDRLTPDGDGSFSVDFPQRAVPHDWVWDNCQVVAFVHKRDKENLRENYVLNAGSDRLNEIALGVNPVTVQQDNVLVSVDRDRRIRTSAPVRDLAVYDLQGRCRDGNSVLSPGVYVIRSVSMSGRPYVKKIIVR